MFRLVEVFCEPTEIPSHVRLGDVGILPGVFHFHFVRFADIFSKLERFESFLDQNELQRAARFKFVSDRVKFVLAHGWVRQMIGRYLGMAPNLVPIERGRFGKPFVPFPHLTFNVSDAFDAVSLVLGYDVELGLDLESVYRPIDLSGACDFCLHERERDYLAVGSDRQRAFFELWTRKESVLKSSGLGIIDGIKFMRVDQPFNTFTINETEFLDFFAQSYWVKTFDIAGSHLASLAAPVPLKNVCFVCSDS
jgi:phosphopantetheinyl transferase